MEQALNCVKWYQYVHQSMYSEISRDRQIPKMMNPLAFIMYRRHPPGKGQEFSTSPQLTYLHEDLRGIKSGLDKFFVNESHKKTTTVCSISEPALKPQLVMVLSIPFRVKLKIQCKSC